MTPDVHRRHIAVALLLSAPVLSARAALPQRTLRVGEGSPIRRIADAARLARDGDVVEIEPGDYAGDVAVWPQGRLTIRRKAAPGDPRSVRLLADGQAAEGKGIWVVRNGSFDIEGIEFHGARVPGRNGAGIRFESGQLRVRNCRFRDNEVGILTGNDGVSELTVESCEFEGRAPPDEHISHNLYVGAIARFEMRACWSHRADTGHLVKTRARESRLFYNRLTDEPGGRASYEIDCPNGGVLVAVGNLIVQEPTTQNNTLVSFGAEGYRWAHDRLLLAHNTLVNRRETGTFVRAYPGNVEVLLANNLFAGAGINEGTGRFDGSGNHNVSIGEFRDAARFDFRLAAGSPLRGRAMALDDVRARATRPTAEYQHPCRLRALSGEAMLSPGAFQG